jgi:regulator of replication initiation timing
MQKLFDQLDRIELKVRQAIQKIGWLQKENKALLEENSILKKLNQKLESEVKNLSEAQVQYRKNIEATEGQIQVKEEFKAELEHYISEIDQCIDWLKVESNGN